MCFSFIQGLTLSISGGSNVTLKEGDNLDILCTPSPNTVGLDWDLPQAVVTNEDTTVVQYREPLRHTLTIRRANINHSGLYICRVAGDVDGTIPSIPVSITVRESKIHVYRMANLPLYPLT